MSVARASEYLERNARVRLVAYRAHDGADEAALARAWKGVTDRAPPGLLYRELGRQVPEWSALIAREIMEPSPFAFLDYAILLPDAEPGVLADPPAEGFDRLHATYDIMFRLAALKATGEPEAILYNLFEIIGPPPVVQGFAMSWPPRADFQSQQDGFFSAALHRRREGDVPAMAFNRAEWRSAAVYERTVDPFERAFPRNARVGGPPAGAPGPAPKITSRLGLFRVEARVVPEKRERQMMRAVVTHRFGGPEVLQAESTPRPIPGPGQMLLSVRAVAINPLDARMRSGEVHALHPAWFPDILGYDIAGVVEEVGAGVDRSRIGEEVFGASPPWARSGYAEYVAVEAGAFGTKPKNISFPAAAAIPSTLATADNALFGIGGLKPGQSVLVHGASGAVGGFAVQLAKRAGARVIATASTANVDRVRALGADVVVDYTKDRFESHAQDVDVVLDTIGADARSRSLGLLRKGGILVTVVPPVPDAADAEARGIRVAFNRGTSAPERLSALLPLFASGKLIPPAIGAELPLARASEAHALVESGKTRGRVVLIVP